MKITTIIFDWDGTIGKTLHLWLAGYRNALQNQDHTILDSVIAKYFFYEHDKAQTEYPDLNFEKLVDETRAHVFSHLDDLELYPGVKDVILELKSSGVTLSLVSSSTRQLLEKGLARHGLTECFSSVISGDDITKHKPDPEAFRQTFELIGKEPSETLNIGDAYTDVFAGKAIGNTTCLFTPPENEMFYDFNELRKTGPDHVITEMPQLLEILS